MISSNTVTLPALGTSNQHEPSLTALANGKFIAIWTHDTDSISSGPNSLNQIRAQIVNADGTLYGAAFKVNTTDLRSLGINSHYPMVTDLADGRFVVAWVGGYGASGVRAQVFNADGTTSGTELLVDATGFSYTGAPSLVALANGGFVAAWTGFYTVGADTSRWSVHAQVFQADGAKLGSDFLVNTTTNDRQEAPELAALPDGRFVATWADGSRSPDNPIATVIRAQIFDADGSPSGTEFLVNATAQGSDPTVTTLADGRFVIAWDRGNAIHAQAFNSDGSKSGTELLATPADTGGTINDRLNPTVTALADGRFVLGWEEYVLSVDGWISINPAPHTVHLQVFNTDGSTAGEAFQVDALGLPDQKAPTITALADGRIAVSWTASAAPGTIGGATVQVQTFDPRTEAILWANASASVDIVGTLWADAIALDSGQNIVHAAAGDDWIHGGSGADFLFGDAGNDTLIGGGGSDTMSGGAGNDILRGGRYMEGGEGNDTLIGSSNTLTMVGGGGNDVFRGQGWATGNDGNDVFRIQGNADGGDGNDVFRGGGYAAGGDGNDTYFLMQGQSLFIRETNSADSGIDTVVSGDTTLFSYLSGQGTIDGVLDYASIVTLSGFSNVENLRLIGPESVDAWGSDINNRITGNAGNNELRGFGGNDTLLGGAGQDTLFGGEGKDRLKGGADSDVFAFQMPQEIGNGANRDAITDFTVGVDKIDLTSIDADPTTFGYQSLHFIGNDFFSHTVGELRYGAVTGILAGDTNGDGIADFQLQLIGKPALSATDLLL